MPFIKGKLGNDYKIVAAHNCRVNKRDFAHLILRNDDKTLSVILAKKNGEELSLNDRNEASDVVLYNGRTQDYTIAGFRTSEHLAFVVSNLKPDENARVASEIAPDVRRLLTLTQTAHAPSRATTRMIPNT